MQIELIDVMYWFVPAIIGGASFAAYKHPGEFMAVAFVLLPFAAIAIIAPFSISYVLGSVKQALASDSEALAAISGLGLSSGEFALLVGGGAGFFLLYGIAFFRELTNKDNKRREDEDRMRETYEEVVEMYKTTIKEKDEYIHELLNKYT